MHGEGFYCIRDNALGAANPFTSIPRLVNGITQSVPLKPDDRRHQFGGVIGGALLKGKLFYFLLYYLHPPHLPPVATTPFSHSLVLSPTPTPPPTSTSLSTPHAAA